LRGIEAAVVVVVVEIVVVVVVVVVVHHPSSHLFPLCPFFVSPHPPSSRCVEARLGDYQHSQSLLLR